MAIPKVAAIHDLSGLGKCSLTAAIPILSVCGVQAVPLATAVLSNQTAFESYTGVDLSEYLPMIAAEWKKRKLSLDGIFTGYLSNEHQVEWVGGFIDSFARGAPAAGRGCLPGKAALWAGGDPTVCPPPLCAGA